MKKKLWTLLTAAALSVVLAAPAYAGWTEDQNGWWYQREDGSWPAQEWMQDETGTWYYFEKDGYMLTDAVTPDGCRLGVDGRLEEGTAIPTVAALNNVAKQRLEYLVCYIDYFKDGDVRLAELTIDERLELAWLYTVNNYNGCGIPVSVEEWKYKVKGSDVDQWLHAMTGRGLDGKYKTWMEGQMEYRDGYYHSAGGDWGMSWPEAQITSFTQVAEGVYQISGISGWKESEEGGWSDYEHSTFTGVLRYTGNPYMQGLTLTEISYHKQ